MSKKTLQDLVADEPSGVHARMEALRARQGWLPKAVAISVAIMNRLEEKKWSQAELARAMGVTPQYISRIVKAEENLSLETITKLETALDMALIVINSKEFQSEIILSQSIYNAEPFNTPMKIIGQTITNETVGVVEQVTFKIEPTAA
jgi:transcriptional regulator with XRE-family HTH domain